MNTLALLVTIGVVWVVSIIVFIVIIKRTSAKNIDNSELITQRENNVRLEENIRSLQSQINDLQNKLNDKEKELKDWRLKNIELSNEVVRAKKNDEFITEKLKDRDNEIAILRQKVSELATENLQQKETLTNIEGAKQILQEKLENTLAIYNKQEQEYRKFKEEYNNLNKEYTQTIATLQAEREKNQSFEKNFKEYKENLENINKQNEERIQNLTNKILEEKTEKFSKTNAEKLDNIVKPLTDEIEKFKKKIEESNTAQVGLHSSLKTEIENIIKQTNQISQDAVNLTNALKGENKRAGNWGEHILETILQNSGLVQNVHYYAQQRIKDEDNKTNIPDFIVKLPNGDGTENVIVIDSKVSLVAYEKYFNADNEEDRQRFLNDHLKSIRAHIDELANKNYFALSQESVGFVMMFVPIEPAYLLAMQSDATLWEYAYKKRIILISATNMISCLRLVADLWKIDTRNKEAQKMAITCGKIYDKMIGFLNTMEDLGKAIDSASDKFKTAKGQLSEGRGNAIKQLEDLKKMGITSKSKQLIPGSLKGEEEDIIE